MIKRKRKRKRKLWGERTKGKQREKKQTHVKHKLIEKQDYRAFVTMEGDENSYSVSGFDPTIMLPDEAVYKPKKKNKIDKPEGLENFMEKKIEDSDNN